MNGFILAAGFGTRMGDLTNSLPKPMLSFKGRPIIDYSLFLLSQIGVEKCYINLHYLGKQIEDHLSDFPHFPLIFSHEAEILGTAGGIRTALSIDSDVDTPLIVTNPDTLFFPGERDESILRSPSPFSILFLTPREPGSREKGFRIQRSRNMTNDSPGILLEQSEDPAFFYTGLSKIYPRDLWHLTPGTKQELAPLWLEQIPREELLGMEFQGIRMDMGTRISYEKSLTEDLPLLLSQERWLAFIRGWGE